METTNVLTAPLRDLRLLRLAQVARLVGLCESRVRQLERAGQFPKRVPIGENSSGYLEGDLRRWLADRAANGRLRLTGAVTEQQRPASTRKATAARNRTLAKKGGAK